MLGVPCFVTPKPVDPAWEFVPCDYCGGRGITRGENISQVPGVGFTNLEPCPLCSGRGHHLRHKTTGETK
jgi:DnaJ-class molecular chaperone